MAEIKKEVGKNGETNVTVIFNDDELAAFDKAKQIVDERHKALGIEITESDRRLIDAGLWGVLRHEGIDALINYATNAKIGEAKKKMQAVGYADYKEMEIK